MVISGAFIFWYWATVLRADATALNANPLVQVIEGVTGAAARVVAARPALVAALLAATVGVSAAITLRRRTTRAAVDDLESDASTPAAGAG